jgi:hypothetical protein
MTSAASEEGAPLFAFVQFEFPWELGPPPGRYVVRDSAAEAELRVLVVKTLGTRERRLFGKRKTQKVEPSPEPALVPTTRVTIVRGVPLASAAEGAAWIEASPEHVPAELGVLNRILHFHRVATAEASVREVAAEQALVVRVGYGEGEQVAEGRWTEAVEPGERMGAAAARRRARRATALAPQERLAALLGGRDAALACEELTLRARSDIDGGRVREAALQLHAALGAALAELEAYRGHRDIDARLTELAELRLVAAGASAEALRGGLSVETVAEVERVLGRVEAALRARSAST